MASRQPSSQIDAYRLHSEPADVGLVAVAHRAADPATTDVVAADAAAAGPGADERRTVAEIARWLAVLVRAGHRLREQAGRLDPSRDVRWSSYAPLTTLVESGPQRVTDLAESLHLSPSSVSRTVAQLISEGLVERTADAADGRACRLEVTALGRVMQQRMAQVRDQAIERALADWSVAERDQLAGLLRRLILDLGLAPAGPSPPSDLGSA